MKSKLFLTVLLLAAITGMYTVGVIVGRRQSQAAETKHVNLDRKFSDSFTRVPELPNSFTSDIGTLSGVEGVWVVIEPMTGDAKAAGLTKDELKIGIEFSLRTAGIKVNSMEEWAESEDGAFLYVKVGAIGDGDALCFSIALGFIQKACLSREPDKVCWSTTWDEDVVGYCETKAFVSCVRYIISYSMWAFTEDYFIANPEKDSANFF